MADQISSPSFIPKQNTAKKSRRSSSRQVYLFTVISYFAIIATLVAVAGMYLFDRYTERVLADEITNLNQSIAAFSVSDMQKVLELDERLKATADRLDNGVSLRTVLSVLEAATVDTVQYEQLEFTRDEDSNIIATAAVLTDSFDSVLFQRRMYEEASSVASVTLEAVTIAFGTEDTAGGPGETPGVTFTAVFSVDKSAAAVPFNEAPESLELPPALIPNTNPVPLNTGNPPVPNTVPST